MLSYIPLIPPTSHTVYSTDDWRHDLSSKSDTRLNYSRKKTIKSKPHPFSSKSLNLKSDKSSLSRHGVESDVISSQDWGEGEVRENVSSIVQALMEKPVKSVRKSEGGCGERGSGHDPRVTMDMRHKQVQCLIHIICHLYTLMTRNLQQLSAHFIYNIYTVIHIILKYIYMI